MSLQNLLRPAKLANSQGCSSGRRLARLQRPPLAKPLAKQSSMAAAGGGGSLWADIEKVYKSAADCGATFKTETETVEVIDGGVGFIVRVVHALAAKDAAGKTATAKGGGKKNPFLPPEEDLFVRNLSHTHCLILNKFNVVPHHALVVTREFQSQRDPLQSLDLDATWEVLQCMPDGLAFYNCGEHSGRSQPHKHVQVVPLPMDGERPVPSWPFADVLAPHSRTFGEPFSVPELPFAHHAVSLVGGNNIDGMVLEGCFDSLLELCAADVEGALSYNVILTRECMLLVPRGAERVGPVAANALGFAGTFLVRTPEELEYVKSEGPMSILGRLGVAQPT